MRLKRTETYIADLLSSEATQECVTWPFSRDRKGYGKIWWEGRCVGAHTIVCAQKHGPRPSEEHHAAHTCNQGHSGCVNPEHLLWKHRRLNLSLDKLSAGTTRPGEKHPSAKLSDADVNHILTCGERGIDLAAKFNVAQSTISMIRRGGRRTEEGRAARRIA